MPSAAGRPRSVRCGWNAPRPCLSRGCKYPLCAGASLIVIHDLIPGAGVEVFANGKTYRAQTPLEDTSLLVIVDALEAPPPGQTRVVSARQEQCGVFGANADDVTLIRCRGQFHRIRLSRRFWRAALSCALPTRTRAPCSWPFPTCSAPSVVL